MGYLVTIIGRGGNYLDNGQVDKVSTFLPVRMKSWWWSFTAVTQATIANIAVFILEEECGEIEMSVVEI